MEQRIEGNNVASGSPQGDAVSSRAVIKHSACEPRANLFLKWLTEAYQHVSRPSEASCTQRADSPGVLLLWDVYPRTFFH